MVEKRYTKSRADKVLSGVLGGFAAYMGWDPTLVRVGFVLLVVFTGFFPGIVAYVVVALVAPDEGSPQAGGTTPPPPPT